MLTTYTLANNTNNIYIIMNIIGVLLHVICYKSYIKYIYNARQSQISSKIAFN